MPKQPKDAGKKRKAELYYISHPDAKYTDVARKFDIKYSTLMLYAKKNEWPKKREEYLRKVAEKTKEKIAEKKSDELAFLADTAENALNIINATLKAPGQFNKYITSEGMDGVMTTCEKEFAKIDTKAIKDLTAALKDVSSVMKTVRDAAAGEENRGTEIKVTFEDAFGE